MNKLRRAFIGLTMVVLASACQANQVGSSSQALVDQGTTSSTTTPGPNSSCFNPGLAPYNAIPDDGLSDRVAMQAAANDASAWSVANNGAQAVVCLGAGRWNCERAPIGTFNRFACVSVHAGNVLFTGVGEATKVALDGDQKQQDMVMISHDPGSSGGIQDLMVTSALAFNTSEQIHMVGTTGVCGGAGCVPIRNLTYRRIVFDHPRATDGNRKGDCMRLIGNAPPTAEVPATETTPLKPATPGTGIYGVIVEDNQFRNCARSGIQNQRGNHHVVIRRNEFWVDQPIHGEATGGTQEGENDDIEVTQNAFHPLDYAGADTFTSDVDVALSGTGSAYTGIHVHHNKLSRGVYLYRTGRSEIDHETIDLNARSSYGVIEIGNICDGVNIHDLSVTRRGVSGPAIRLTPHSGAICINATLSNNVIFQNTTGHSIYTEAVAGLRVIGNTVTYGVPAPKFSAIYARSTAGPISGMAINGNTVVGPVTYAVSLSAAPFPFGDGNELSGNTGDGTIACGGAGGFAPIMSSGNAVGSMACPTVVFTTPPTP